MSSDRFDSRTDRAPLGDGRTGSLAQGPFAAIPTMTKFLEAAVAARADYVASGDVALLNIKNYQRTQIIRAAQFLKVLSR